MEIECDLASIRDEDLLRKMWQQSEDFGRKKEIRSHLYKLRESRLREFYSTGGPGGEIMNPSTDLHYGKTPLTQSHGDSLVDQSFQSLKSKEIRDSLSPTHDIKFRNSGGVAGGVLVPDTTGWDVQTSSEVSPDGRAFRTESLAKTDGVEKIPGGHAEFAGRNEQKSSASHQGDDKNYVKKAAESSKTHLQEKVVIGDENSGRTEMKSSSVTSSSKVISSSSQQVLSSDDPGFDMQPRRLTNQDQQYHQNVLQAANNNISTSHSERQQFSRNERNERQETSSSNVREESKKYIDMDKASPEYQQHVQYLMSQPGAIISNTVEYPKPGVKMITTVKKLPDGTTVKTKRYETEASAAAADTSSISQTMKQQQQQRISSNTTTSQKMTEKRSQESEDVFTRLARTRDQNVPSSPRNAPETPSNEDVYSRLQQTRGVNEQKFSDSLDQRSTQILRDTQNQHPGSRNAPNRRPSDQVENVEIISKTNKTVKQDHNQSVRSEKITSSDFIQNERDRYVLDHESPIRRGPDGYPEALAPITPSRHGRPHQPDDYPSNGLNATEVIKQSSSSKSSAKFSESRRYSTETVESYQHSENENQDYTTRGYPSNRRPIDEPKSQSPSSGRPAADFSTHGFPSVRSDKPTQQHPSDKPRAQDEYYTTEKIHVIHTDRPRTNDVSHSDSTTTTRSNYSTNETRRHVTSTNEDFSTHGFPSVRAGTPTRDSPRRPLGADSTPGESPRRPSGQEPPSPQARKPPSDGYSTHGFPSVKSGSPTEDSPRRPSSTEPINQGRRPTTGRSTPTQQSAPQYESSPRVDREDTVSVTSDRSNSVIYEKKIDAAHQAFARSLRCASPVESIRRDSTSDRHTPRSSVGSIRNSYSPSKRDGRSPSHDSVTNSESSRISSGTVTKSQQRPSEVRRLSSPKSPSGKSAPRHVSNETIDLSLTRKITAKPSSDKTTARPTTSTTPNTSRRPHNTEEDDVNTLIDTATKHITTHPSSVIPTTRSTKNKDSKPIQPETLHSKKPITKPEGYINLKQASEITEKDNQTTNKHVSYPNYIPSAPKADRSPSDRPTTNNLSSPAPNTTTTSTTPHNAPKSTKDKVKPPSTISPTTKPLSSPSKVDNSTSSRFTKTVKVENAINRDTTTKTRRQPKVEPESELDTERLAEPEDLDEGYVPDRKGKKKPSSQRPTSDDEGFEPDSPRAGSPTSDFEYRRPEQLVETYDEEDSFLKKTKRVDKKVVTNDFLDTERNVTKTRKTQEIDEPNKRPKDRDFEKPEGPTHPDQDGREPSYLVDKSTGPQDRSHPENQEPKRPLRRTKEEDTDQIPSSKDRKPSQLIDEPRKNIRPNNEQIRPDEEELVDEKPSRPSETSRPRGTKPPLERSETFEERCRQILGMDSDTVVDRTKKTQEFIDTERTTVDSKRKPSDRSPSPKKKQPSDTVSIEDCDDDDDAVTTPRKNVYPGKTTTTTTKTVKTTPEQPRDKSPNKKESASRPREENTGDYPRKLPKGTKINENVETSSTVITTKITDDRSTSPNRKSPKPSEEDDIRPRGRSPSERTDRVDETTTFKKTKKIVDEIDEKSSRSKPSYRSRDQSPQETRPRKKSPDFERSPSSQKAQPSDTVSIEDCDDDSDTSQNYLSSKTKTTKTTVKATRDHPREKSPSEKGPNRKSPIKEVKPIKKDDFRPRGLSPSETIETVDHTTRTNKTTKIDERSTRPRDQSPQETQPREKSPADARLPSSTRPKDRSPSEKRSFITTRETTFDVETSPTVESLRDKSPSKKPIRETSPSDEYPRDRSAPRMPVRETSPTDESPRDKSPSKKPIGGTSPTDEFPCDKSDRSPTRNLARGTSPTDEYPRDRSPTRSPARERSPTDESPRYKSTLKKPIHGTSPSDEYPRDRSPTRKPVSGKITDETITSSTITTQSTVTDGLREDRYPSYTPKSFPSDRSPLDKQKPKPKTTEEEDVVIETSRKTKKTSTKEIQDDVFEVNRPRERQPDTRDGSFLSQPREQSPSEPASRPRTNEIPRDKSPEKLTTKETDESIAKRTSKITRDTTIESEFTDKSPVPRPRDYPRDRSPNKKPITEETEEYRGTTKTTTVDKEVTDRTRPSTYPRDQSPVDDLTRPTTKEITETHSVDKKTAINEFLDTERGVDRPQRPKEKKPFDNDTSPERLTSSHPRDYPGKEIPTTKLKGPMSTDIDESTIVKTTKATRDTRIENEVEEVLSPSTRPRDRSPTEKPIRSPRIVTTETTTEYGIRSRPRSQSPSEKPKEPSDSEEIDETYVQKTSKITEKKTTTTDLDVDVKKPSRRPRPTGTEDQPREKSPQKPKSIDRSPSPRSRYPKEQGPTSVGSHPQSRSPVGKQPKTTGSPRQTSPSEKPRTYHTTDEETSVVKKSKKTKVTTTSEDVKDVELENRPRGRSPSEKPKGLRPSNADELPRDHNRGPSPTKKPEDRRPTERDYEEAIVKRTSKTTRNETTLEEKTDRSPRNYPDKPREKSPSSKSKGIRPTEETTEDLLPKSPRGISPSEKSRPKGYNRDRSPSDKPRKPILNEETIVQTTSKRRTTLEDRSPKYPRETSPTERPGSRDYPHDRSPSDKNRKPGVIDETTVDRTTIESKTTKDRLSKSPRGTSPTEKSGPRDYPRDRSPTDKSRKPRLYDDTFVGETTTLESTTTTERLSKSPRRTSPSEKVGPRDYPRDRSPTDKPRKLRPSEETTSTEKPASRQSRPVGETVVKRTVKTTTVDDHTTKTSRGSSPTKTSPRERSPTQKPTTVYDRSPKDSPRRTSPSEKPNRRQPIISEEEKTVRKTTSKFSKDTKTSEKIKVQDYPRKKSPSEKPKRRPTSDEETDDETTETVIAVYTIDGETVKNHPRELSPSGKPKQPNEYSPQRPQTNGDSDRPRHIYPKEKPRRQQPSDEETEETFTSTTSRLTKESKTLEEIDIDDVLENRSPKGTYPRENQKATRDQPRETSPSGKPRRDQPTHDESVDITVMKKTSRTQKGETTLEETEYQFPEDRHRDRSPSGKPSVRTYPRDSSPEKPTGEDIDETVVIKSYRKTPFDEDDMSPLQKPKSPQTAEETIIYTTRITSKTDEDHPRDRSPSNKSGTRSHPRDRSPTDKPGSRTYPRDKSPSDKPSSRPRSSKIEETTNRLSTTLRKTVQETDFEKRYPKSRPGDQSPSEKPSTLRRPSKLSATTTTTTTRNRSTLDEQDINKTQRPRTQPSSRDKVPSKTSSLSSPRTQPITERRIPAELPSPLRKPKPTFGVTKTTTTVTRLTSRQKPTTETPKKPSKLPLESRPSARPTERKHSPSISPDSSPSRPGSDVEIDSPYRSPNMSPSRNSPSPTRSVKLEDITTTDSNTRKTTVSIDKSKPKVTHVTTARFQVTPPTSPTKVISSPEMKYSPSSKKPSSKVPTPSKPIGSKFTTNTATNKKVTSKVYNEGPIPTDSERDSEVPTDAEEVDTPLPQKPLSRKLPVTERKESAPVHRVTKINKDVHMSRSTSENIIKTPINKRPGKHEPLEPQRESPRPSVGDRSTPKTERRPSKHLSTKTINLTTFDKVINSEDMENVVIDIQHAKSSREPSPNKIVPTPVSVDMYTGKPRYPDVVQEPEDEPKKKPNVKNIPIFEEETNDFIGCQITEVNEETREKTLKARTTKFIEKESSPRRPTPKIVTGDNVDSECLLSVHDKVSKFISTAEEVSKPKTSAPFRRDVPEEDMPEDDECLLTVDEKVSKFLKTADSVTKEVVTSKPRRVERPSVEDLDEDLKTDECVLSVSEKVNKFTTKAEKLAPTAPQRSPELVARIERQISRQSDVESESPEGEDSPASVRKFKPTSPLTERSEKKYTERQIDILSRPSVWEKKPKSDIKLDDIIGFKPEEEPRRETCPDDEKSKPVKTTDSVSKRKQLFESKVSTNKTITSIKQSSPEKRPIKPAKSPSERHPSDDSDSRYPSEFSPRYVDHHQEPDDDVHEDVYGSSRTRHTYETSNRETVQRSTERSPTRKSSHPEDNRPTKQITTKSPRQPDENTPSRRYSEDHSPRYPTRDQPSTDRYTETRETSDHTTRRRSSTQEYPERRTPYNGSHSPLRKQPVEEPEDYTFSSRRDETTTHHTTRTAPRSPKDSPLNPTSFLDDEEQDHSPARSTSTVSSHKQVTTQRSTTKRLTEDISSRRPRRPSGNEPTTTTSGTRTPRGRAVPETVAARRNIFEKSPGDISPMPTNRRPSYMEPTKSSLEHRKDSLEITKTNYSRKSSMEEEPYEPSPKTSVKFGVGLKQKEEPKAKRKLSSSDIPNIEDVFELDLLEEMLNIVTLYEQRRRIRAQIRVVKKLLETKTKEEVSRMTKITTIRKTSSSSVRESPTPKRETTVRSERYQLTDDDIDSESIIESHHVEEHEEIKRERSVSPKTKSSRIVTKVTEVRKIGEPTTPNKRTPLKTDEPKDSKPIWATKNILKKPSDNEKVTRALSAKKTTSTSSSSMSRTQQTHRQRVSTDDDCVTSSYGIGPTDEDGRPLFGIRALKKKTTTNNTVQPSETTKVTGTVITEKYYSENGAEPVGERKVTVYSTNPEDLVDLETQYDRRDSETVKREKLSKDGVTTVTKVQKIGKYKQPGEIPSLTAADDAEFTKATSKMVRRGSVKEMSEKFIRKESSSSVTEKSSGYPKAGLILRTRTNSGATADTADQYEVRAKSTEYDYDSEDDVEIRSSRKHSKVVNESEDETEIRRKINTRSFLNSSGSKVTGVDDVLDRMRNADNVVVDGDTLEDREARSLLNKFLGASVLMSGMESMIPQMELRKTTGGADNKQEVKTTRVTKTIKSGTTGGSSSSTVARETFDFEEIWDEEILKQLLEKSTSYEERRSIRARLRQLMADREACAELKAGAKAELNETKVKTSTTVADDESSGSEYEEIIEEYTASEDDDEDEETTTTVIAEKQQKDEVKEEQNSKQITEGIKKTTITKKVEPKSVETKKTVVVETTTVIEEDGSSPSCVEEKKLNTKPKEEETDITNNDDEGDDSDSVSDSKGESLLIPLLQGLLHKNMPQARLSSGSSAKIATNSATTSNQNSNNLKSSLKANNTHFSSTSKSNNNNSLGDSGLSSEVSKNSSLGQKQKESSLRVPQQIEDSGTESGEDLRLIAAGIRDSMQIEGIENHSDMSLIKEVTNALNKLESSLKEGKDLALDNSKKSTLLALVERLQTGLTAPDKLSSAVEEQDFPDETSSPEADNHRSNRQRFAKRKNRNNRHTVGVSKEELADARRYMEEMVMIENLSNCTTPECNAATTPPELFAIQKQHSTGAILSSHEPQEASAGLFRPNQFVPNNLKHSTEAGSGHPEVQLRQKKGTPAPGQRQSTGDMNSMKVPNSDPNNGKRPLSDSFDAYTAQNNRVTFNDPKPQNDNSVEEKNQYNRSHHSDDNPNNPGRLSPDSSRFNRFNNKKQLMKRANTIDIPKTHRYNPEFDTDSDFEERSALHTKGLRGTLQVNVKRKPRQVVPNFEPKTENDHKFLAFIQKQSTTTGLGWNSSKSVSNWTNKFGNIKNVFESGANVSNSNRPKNSGPPSSSSAKSFWIKSEEQNPPKTSTSVLTSALKAKERNEKRGEVVVPKPIHLNKFSHNPQSAFRPVDTSPETIQMQFKPIPMEKPSNVVVNSLSPTKAYNPVRRQALESPHYSQSSPTKSWIKKNTATNSPVTLPWTVKPPENNVLKIAATKFESNSPVQRHQSFKQQEKRPSLPNTSYPYQYQDYGHSQQSYVSNSQPTSYAEYPPQPRIFRESSLTNPQAEPLILTSNAPAYSPHSLQPFDYYTSDELNQHVHQTDMTDDDIDDMESMTEYRVEAKVMGKPLSQQAVTVGKRTSHMSDDEVFGKNSRAAKNLLSVMKNIGNGKPDRTPKKPEKPQQPPSTCISPNGSAYQAPIVEPLFPEVTKFEANRDPEYIGQQNKQQAVGYHKNPVYVPLEDYHHNEPPVAPPRGRKLSQETKKGSSYVPKERPNIYPSPRRDTPSSLPIQAGPTSPPRYMYSSPIKSPESSSAATDQILNDGMYMQNVPAFRKPYSEPNTPSDYSASNEAYFNQYGQMQKSYPAPQPPVILPQIPLETSYTKVYDQPRDVASFYKPPVEHPNSSAYIQSSHKVQQNSQPSMYIPPEYQQKSEQQYYQSPKVQQGYAPQQAYQPRTEDSPEYYHSPKVQQSQQQSAFIPQHQTYQPRAEVPQEYNQAPRTQQIPQPQGVTQSVQLPKAPVTYYQSPQIQSSPQPLMFAQQYSDTPVQYDESPRVQQSPRSDVPPSFYQSPKTQQSTQQPNSSPQTSEIPSQYSQSPKIPQMKSSAPSQQGFKYPIVHPQQHQTQPLPTQTYQSSKSQQSPQPMSPLYQLKAPMIQTKPQVPPKSESVMQSTKFQHSSSSYHQQQIQNVVTPTRPVEPQAPNAAVLCKQASLEGRKRVQSQSQKYEQVEEVRRKSIGNVLEVTRVEREAREQKAAAIKQDMYSVQQDVYSQQKSMSKKTEVHQQETKVMYKSSAPDDTPDIVKSSLKKDDIPILKKFGPPQRHCYMPNAYQNPLMKSETTIINKSPKPVSRKFSDPAVSRGPVIVEIPSTPQPDSQDEIPRNIVFNKISAFTSMSRKQAETSTEYTSQQSRPNKLSKCDSWHQICQLQNVPKPPSPRFNNNGNAALRRSKSGHTLALPKLYEASYDRAQISEKQRTVAAYFTGQKSPNSLSRNSSQTNLAEESNYVSVKKSSINRIKTSEKASISRQDPSSGLSRSHTMPQIANVNLLDESNVEDAFEQLMNGKSTTTTEKTETKKEDGGVVTTTTKVTTRTISGAPKPVSPFAKFQQLDKQNSLQSPKSPLTPTTPGGSSSTPIFRFTDPALNARAATFKEQLLQWCQSKTQEYENVQITNFSASWTDGLAFCALIHHFLPDAFDYSKLNSKQRRYNFELAFRVADEKAGIAPLLDVEDMVVMKRPDWKCVFTYVQSIYRRFRNCQ